MPSERASVPHLPNGAIAPILIIIAKLSETQYADRYHVHRSVLPYCAMAKRLLHAAGVGHIDEIRVDASPEAFAEMQRLSGQRSVPQIFIGETHVGGFTDLYRLQQEGGLDGLLNP